MAKYTINFSCGHGSYEEQLYGPEKDRQRKIAWLQSNKTCKACWLAAQKSKDASAPRLAHITADYRDLSVTVRIENGVDANKGALLEMGFEWSRDYRGGINEMFAMRDAPLALCRTHKFISTDETMAWVDGVKGEITPLGYAIKTDISPLDIEMFNRFLADRAAEVAAKEALKAANPAPALPAWLQALFDVAVAAGREAKTNGKIYGGSGRHTIYVGGEPCRLTDEQVAELLAYQKARAAPRAARES